MFVCLTAALKCPVPAYMLDVFTKRLGRKSDAPKCPKMRAAKAEHWLGSQPRSGCGKH